MGTEVLVRICFGNDVGDQHKHMVDLMKFLEDTGGDCGSTVADLSVDGNDLVIELGKGFHCLYLPLNQIKNLMEAENGD